MDSARLSTSVVRSLLVVNAKYSDAASVNFKSTRELKWCRSVC